MVNNRLVLVVIRTFLYLIRATRSSLSEATDHPQHARLPPKVTSTKRLWSPKSSEMDVRATTSYFSKPNLIWTEQLVATVASHPLVLSTVLAPAASITIRSGTQTCSTQAQESRWVQIITLLGHLGQAILGTTISFPTPRDPQSMPNHNLWCQYPSIWCHPEAMQALMTTSQS